MAVIKSGSREVSYATAGDLPLYVLRAASGEVQEIDGSGESLGIAPGTAFATRTLKLEKGDRILLGNGGIERLENKSGSQLGADRWMEIATAANAAGVDDFRREVRTKLNEFLGEAKLKEDIIMMTACAE